MTTPDPKGRKHILKPTYPCNLCGDPVQPRRRSASGSHYCAKPDCQRMKARLNYRARVGPADDRGWLPTECSNPECSSGENGHAAKLPARLRRHNDSTLGRWCRAAACQRHRKSVERQAAMAIDTQAVAERDFLVAAMFEERVTCPECGIDGVPGFAHPNEYAEVCMAQGDRNPGSAARKVWAERFGV